jgi:hypothetical protein
MSSKRTTFIKDWLTDPQFSGWLKELAHNKHQARCSMCSETFELSNMGRQAVSSHQKSALHLKNSKSASSMLGIGAFLEVSRGTVVLAESPSDQQTPQPGLHVPSSTTVESGPPFSASSSVTFDSTEVAVMGQKPDSRSLDRTAVRTVKTYLINDSVSKSEILWALKIVMNHLSFRSCLDIGETFQQMFPDSEIAKKFTLSKTKAAYSIVHGRAPFFKETLDQQIRDCQVFVACFDEALNRVAQRGQMDIVIRYWNGNDDQVASRYFTSVFLGHATAADLLLKFKEGLSVLSLQKLIQVSMDGPSVNWKFLPQLLDLGSCGLHVIHGAFQTGHKAASWAVNETLRGLFGLFKDSPVRRADYISQTGNALFPKKCCQVRWLANADVANRAIEVLPHVKKFVDNMKKLPNNLTCRNVSKACADPLSIAKLAFFASVASMFESFLRKYQTAQPMIVFLYDDIACMLRCVLQRFVKKSLMQEAQKKCQQVGENKLGECRISPYVQGGRHWCCRKGSAWS